MLVGLIANYRVGIENMLHILRIILTRHQTLVASNLSCLLGIDKVVMDVCSQQTTQQKQELLFYVLSNIQDSNHQV